MQDSFRVNIEEAGKNEFLHLELLAPISYENGQNMPSEHRVLYTAAIQIHWLVKASGNSEKIKLRSVEDKDQVLKLKVKVSFMPNKTFS